MLKNSTGTTVVTGSAARMYAEQGLTEPASREAWARAIAVRTSSRRPKERRAAELQLAALMGNAQLGWFSQYTGGTTRLDYLRCIEDRNPNCLRVHFQEQPRTVVVAQPREVVEIPIGSAIGYTLVVPLTASFDNLLVQDPLTFFNTSFATKFASDCIAGPGELYTSVVIDEVVSFPYTQNPHELLPWSTQNYSKIMKCMFEHMKIILEGLTYAKGKGFAFEDGRLPPKLICWALEDHPGARLARSFGFKAIDTKPTYTGRIFTRFELDLNEVDPTRPGPKGTDDDFAAETSRLMKSFRTIWRYKNLTLDENIITFPKVPPETRPEETKKQSDGPKAPTIGNFLRQVHQLREARAKAQTRPLEDLRAFLGHYADKRFENFDHNINLADMANQLASEAGCELRYEGQPVRVECRKTNARSKYGDFIVRLAGTSTQLKKQVVFPRLEVLPLNSSPEATLGQPRDVPRNRTA
jgi:hypothetical protein